MPPRPPRYTEGPYFVCDPDAEAKIRFARGGVASEEKTPGRSGRSNAPAWGSPPPRGTPNNIPGTGWVTGKSNGSNLQDEKFSGKY